MLTVADTFAAKGFVTVAIDAAKHGDVEIDEVSKTSSRSPLLPSAPEASRG